jgi:hypothetical protein
MYWLLVAPIALLAYKIYDKFSSKEEKAKKDWEENKKNVEQRIVNQEIKIKNYLKQRKTEADYYQLKEVHFTSMKIADQAYNLLNYSKVYYDAMNRNVKLTSDRKKEILELFKSGLNYKKKLKLTQELKQIDEVRKSLFKNKEVLENQITSFKSKLKNFNMRTSKFKYQIRDNCGDLGKNWFDRLEQRKNNRK